MVILWVTITIKKEIMAVNINRVYQRVLAIANKEQRGYVTPQEFNVFANHAQMDILEQYFYDINQFGRTPGNSDEYSNILDNLQEKIVPFQQWKKSLSVNLGSLGTLPSDPALYRLGKVFYNKATATGSSASTFLLEIEEIKQNEIDNMELSPLTRATSNKPYYVRLTDTTIDLYPRTLFSLSTGVVCNYVKTPSDVKWGFTMVNNEALYNASTSVNFELHPSEETKLILKILELSGIEMKDAGLYQIADKEETENTQQEKI